MGKNYETHTHTNSYAQINLVLCPADITYRCLVTLRPFLGFGTDLNGFNYHQLASAYHIAENFQWCKISHK